MHNHCINNLLNIEEVIVNFQRTSRLTAFIASALHDTAPVSSIAKRCNVSVLDILPSRSQTFLTSYFRNIPKKERYRIEFLYVTCGVHIRT